MSLIYTKLALGVEWSGSTMHLVALGRRFRHFVVLGGLHLPEALDEGARNKVSEFLDRHRMREARVVACLPREAVLVRFLDLPAEAEPRLTQVVGYQISVLHPFQDAQVLWDCAVVAREQNQIQVMVVLAEKSRLDWHRQVLANLGLRVNSLTLVAASLTALMKAQLPETVLVVRGRTEGVELIGFNRGNLVATRDIPVEPSASAVERFERELHSVRAVLPDPAQLALFTCGSLPSAFPKLLSDAAALPAPKLPLSQPPGFELADYFPALAAAYVGLVRKPAPSINLLSPEERWQPKRRAHVPLYALGTTAALLTLVVTAHAWIENALYARALERQIQALQSRASEVRQESQQASTLAARAAWLDSLRAETWRKLQLLQELTRLLPDGTWVRELQLEEKTAELDGYSNRAADLVQPLENSPYFSQVEFTSPIMRDAQSKEIFRIRMRLKQPVRP